MYDVSYVKKKKKNRYIKTEILSKSIQICKKPRSNLVEENITQFFDLTSKNINGHQI